MKLLLFVCFLAAAAADNFLQRADPAIDESVVSFFQGAVKAGALTRSLGIDDPEIEQMADDVETALGRAIREALKEMLEKIKDHIDNGKAVGRELIEKVKDLRQKLKEVGGEKGEKVKEMLQHIREKAKEVLKTLLERLGLGKRNMDDILDRLSRMKFRDLVEKIREKILSDENIQKIREYIRNRYGDSPLLKKLKEFIEKLSDRDLREIVSHLFDYQPGQSLVKERAMGEAWDKLKKFFKDLNIKIQEHSRKFGQWVKDMWGKGLDKLKDKYGTIRAIAMEFIANSKDMSADMAREALEFFRPYKDDLGSLWNQIVDASKEIIGKF